MHNIQPLNGIRLVKQKEYVVRNNILCPQWLADTDLFSPDDRINHVLSMIRTTDFQEENKPSYYVHRIVIKDYSLIGLIGLMPIKLLNRKIRCHEQTLLHKTQKQIASFSESKLQINPVLLLHRSSADIEQCLNQIILNSPEVTIHSSDKETRYQLWIINDEERINELSERYNALDRFYVGDGHHRLAATIHLKRKNDFFMSILVSENKVRLKSYNRILADLNGLSSVQFLEKLQDYFDVKKISSSKTELMKREYLLYLDRQWYTLIFKEALFEKIPFVKALDSSIINEFIFYRILNLNDETIKDKVNYLPGIYESADLEEKINQRFARAALFLPPLKIDDLFTVCDRAQILPANSTWFEPKILDGLISYMREAKIMASTKSSLPVMAEEHE